MYKQLVYHGKLVFLTCSSSLLKLTSCKYMRQFSDDIDQMHNNTRQSSNFSTVCDATLKMKNKLKWKVQCAKECSQNKTGHNGLFILISSEFILGEPACFCVIQAIWKSDSLNLDESQTVELVPILEFSCADHICDSMLACGPTVVGISDSNILVFSRATDMTVNREEFAFHDDHPEGSENCVEARILAVYSENDWIVVVLSRTFKGRSLGSATAFEKLKNGKMFRRDLCVGNIFPAEYASKMRIVTVQLCRQTLEGNTSVYRNSCVVGLTDGYVMAFTDGEMQMCVSLCSPHAAPVFAVEDIVTVGDVFICHTDTATCFAVSSSTGKVLQQWSGVTKVLTGDFVEAGRQQLLLLFDANSDHSDVCQPPEVFAYFLTDFQGLVDDQRPDHHETTHCPTSPSLHSASLALQEQCQLLSRSIAEEEEKVAVKKKFVGELWRRLKQDQGHH